MCGAIWPWDLTDTCPDLGLQAFLQLSPELDILRTAARPLQRVLHSAQRGPEQTFPRSTFTAW